MSQNMIHEKVWLDKNLYEDAERIYYEGKAKEVQTPLAAEVGRAREWLTNIKNYIEDSESQERSHSEIHSISYLEEKLNSLEKIVASFQTTINYIVERVKHLDELNLQQVTRPINLEEVKLSSKEVDDNVDLFGSDSENDETVDEIRKKRLAEYENKKSKKPALIAKSNIILDVKPWDDETDMKAMETAVRQIQSDGLVWGASKLQPLAYGIHKLQISCVVEDDIVSVDWLQEKIQENEDYVQSVDIAAFNKV